MDKKNYKETLGNIEAFVFDVDGVMTDGSVTIFPTGERMRCSMFIKRWKNWRNSGIFTVFRLKTWFTWATMFRILSL